MGDAELFGRLVHAGTPVRSVHAAQAQSQLEIGANGLSQEDLLLEDIGDVLSRADG